jgi:prevent-host-death family protein
MDIGVRELKQHLSEWLERASRGETIRVTDRGRPKAILGPVPGEDRIRAGVDEGWIRPGTGKRLGRTTRHRATRPVADVLNEDRGS